MVFRQAEQRKFYERCLERGLEPFYDKMVEQGINRDWSAVAPNLDFKREIIDLIERYKQELPVTEFTDDEQWYLAVPVDEAEEVSVNRVAILDTRKLNRFSIKGC